MNCQSGQRCAAAFARPLPRSWNWNLPAKTRQTTLLAFPYQAPRESFRGACRFPASPLVFAGSLQHCVGRTLRASIMSAELIGILGVGATLLVGLGGLVLALQTRTDRRLAAMEAQTAKRFDAIEARLDAVQAELRRLGERVARSEGLMQGAGLLRVVSRFGASGDWRIGCRRHAGRGLGVVPVARVRAISDGGQGSCRLRTVFPSGLRVGRSCS